MKRSLITIIALAAGSLMTHAGGVFLGGTNHVVAPTTNLPAMTFTGNSVAFTNNGEVDLTPYFVEGTLEDIENFELLMAQPHTNGWTWLRMNYDDGTGSGWIPMVSWVVDDMVDDSFMSHAEWPDDNGYKDGWTSWGTGTYGMSVDRADLNGDGVPDGWKVYQVDSNRKWNLVHTYSWASLPTVNGPNTLTLAGTNRIRFERLGKWDSSEELATFSVRGGTNVPSVRFGPTRSNREVLSGGMNQVIGQGVQPSGLTFGQNTIAFDKNGEVDLTPYFVEGTLGDIQDFQFFVARPHTNGWTWLRMNYDNGTGSGWIPMVSWVVDDMVDDSFMSHAEWPDDNGYKDGWTSWGSGTYGMSVVRADLNNDGVSDGWKVYQVDASQNTNLVQSYSWASLPTVDGPNTLALDATNRIRFERLGKWDSSEDLASFSVRGGDTVPEIRFGPLQSNRGRLLRNVRATTVNGGQYVVVHYGAGVAMHPTLSSRTIASLPAYLNGAEGFKTAQEDRGVTGGLVSFSLLETANVYVCWDASCSTSWLTGGGWTQMAELVQISGDPGAPTRQIWRKRFEAGAVDLPGPSCGSGNNMFVLVTDAAPEITEISVAGDNVTVTWIGGGTLYSNPSLNQASWTTTGDSDGSYTGPVGTGNRFFRVQR